uniref:Uncharacterized protein n=1 Tax=Arundo donax TaxID=35708 RepID=A0A0A9D5B5_ARUDO
MVFSKNAIGIPMPISRRTSSCISVVTATASCLSLTASAIRCLTSGREVRKEKRAKRWSIWSLVIMLSPPPAAVAMAVSCPPLPPPSG